MTSSVNSTLRSLSYLVSLLLLVFGALVLVTALAALAISWFTPQQPPPSMNEGQGLFGFLGWLGLGIGGVSALIGLAILSGLRRTRPPHESAEWARQHRRIW